MKQRVLQNLLTFLMLLFLTMMGFCQSKINRDKNPITVPLDLSTQRPILELMINGTGPYRFIFDTGSSTNVIDQEIADKLSLEVIGEDSLQTQGSDNK
ncbi:MAG: aspartyl protease family protein, partial [Ignavibacteriaceae bacterium]